MARTGSTGRYSTAASVEPMRALVDENAARGRVLLQPRRRRDDVADDHPLPLLDAGAEPDERRPGRDGCAQHEIGAPAGPVADRERRTDRALGVVLVDERRAEESDDGVADELLHRASELLELVRGRAASTREQRPGVFRIEPLGALGVADEIDEDDADDLALVARFAEDGSSRAPQAGQKRASAGASRPQPGHRTG